MDLTGPQREQLKNALLAAATSVSALEQMVSLRLDENLAAITEGNLSDRAFQLVTWAEAQGRLEELVRGARTFFPGSEPLKTVAEDFDRWKTAPPEAMPQGLFHQPAAAWVSPVQQNKWRYKLVAFDLDGTLLRAEGFAFSWEAVWRKLGFGAKFQNELKREYRSAVAGAAREIRIKAYQNWCDRACEAFARRGLTRGQLREISATVTLTNACKEALTALRRENVATAIISGGMDTFLEDAFPEFRDYFDFVFINHLVFSSAGALTGVRATAYDFEGKADALDVVCERVGCTSKEAVFVGDHFNDESIMLKADKAIAYPPHDVIVKGASQVEIAEDNLLAILPHVLVE